MTAARAIAFAALLFADQAGAERRVHPEYRRVTATVVHDADVLVDVETSASQTITTTPDHRFYVVGQGFRGAGGLAVGDALVTEAGASMAVRSIVLRRPARPARVYNLNVDGAHTYFVGRVPVLVHNGSACALGPAATSAGAGAAVRHAEERVAPRVDARRPIMPRRGDPAWTNYVCQESSHIEGLELTKNLLNINVDARFSGKIDFANHVYPDAYLRVREALVSTLEAFNRRRLITSGPKELSQELAAQSKLLTLHTNHYQGETKLFSPQDMERYHAIGRPETADGKEVYHYHVEMGSGAELHRGHLEELVRTLSSLTVDSKPLLHPKDGERFLATAKVPERPAGYKVRDLGPLMGMRPSEIGNAESRVQRRDFLHGYYSASALSNSLNNGFKNDGRTFFRPRQDNTPIWGECDACRGRTFQSEADPRTSGAGAPPAAVKPIVPKPGGP